MLLFYHQQGGGEGVEVGAGEVVERPSQEVRIRAVCEVQQLHIPIAEV